MNNTCTQGAVHRFVTGGHHDSGLKALMIASRLPYIITLKRDLSHAHYKNDIMNICIFME